jgi:thiamine-monophosphate kinase
VHSEFSLIRRYFDRPSPGAALGVGDDCALMRLGAGMELAVSTDMLVEDRHFSAGTDAWQLGHKSLAVNLSDMAAMGATPRWATLALALPEIDEVWLEQFSSGFFALAARFGVELVGGDTTRGPRNISVTIMGELPAGQALYRSGAQPGDDIWVSGELGGAALGLSHQFGRVPLETADAQAMLMRLHQPEPRVALGERLRKLASSAIDVSDGFAGDLAHVLERSAVGAVVHYAQIPRPAVFARLLRNEENQSLERNCVLSGGDDYELIFTAPLALRGEIEALGAELGLAPARVGFVRAGEARLALLDVDGHQMPAARGFDHFA